MIVFPAIDIKDGKVVRLAQGKFEYVTQYSDDPVTMAQKWASLGAEWLHVVDLDGAQTGEMKNFSIISKIIKSVRIPVQVGGGVQVLVEGRVCLGARVCIGVERSHSPSTV